MCVSARAFVLSDRDEKLITHWVSEEIPDLLWKQVYNRVHNSLPLAHILSQICPVRTSILFP
jgi:hypothetical protein